jgi:hypothetical protein
MNCPVCKCICGEFHDKEGVTFLCNTPNCTWGGLKELNKAKDDKNDKKK